MADLLGDGFEVLALLGQGGMGTVYKARQKDQDRIVAVKILRQDLCSDEAHVRRFCQEAQLLCKVSDPHLRQVYAVGVAPGGEPYMVLEFVDGTLLADLLTDQSVLGLARCRAVFVQICAALESIHAAGIIHRDLKPANVMLVPGSELADCVKVLDFGIATAIDPDLSASQKLTTYGSVLGSPAYMSPEQLGLKQIDARSDVYSLGALMYATISGAPPFVAETPMALMYKHVHEEPLLPIGRADGTVAGARLERIVSRALAKNPPARYQSARDLRLDLEALTASDLEPARGRRRQFATRTTVAAVLVVLASTVLLALVQRRPWLQEPAPVENLQPVITVSTSDVAGLSAKDLTGKTLQYHREGKNALAEKYCGESVKRLQLQGWSTALAERFALLALIQVCQEKHEPAYHNAMLALRCFQEKQIAAIVSEPELIKASIALNNACEVFVLLKRVDESRQCTRWQRQLLGRLKAGSNSHFIQVKLNGFYLLRSGQLQEAKAVLQQALLMPQAQDGHEAYYIHGWLSATCLDMADRSGLPRDRRLELVAEGRREALVAERLIKAGQANVSGVDDRNPLALVVPAYYKAGCYGDALTLAKELLGRRPKYVNQHTNALLYLNKGRSERALAQLASARASLEKACSLARTWKGEVPREVQFESFTSLAGLCIQLGDIACAHQCLDQAWAIGMSAASPRLATVIALNRQLCRQLVKSGRADEALALARRMLSLAELQLGRESSITRLAELELRRLEREING